MPGRMYELLHSEGFRLPLRRRSRAHGEVPQNAVGRFRAPLRLPDENSAAAAHAAPYSMPFSARRWLLDSSRETYAVPRFSVLAGTGGRQTGVAQDGGV